MKRMTILAALTAVILALAGCGSSSSSSSTSATRTSTSPSSGANFATKANQICAGVNAKETALPAIGSIADLLKQAPQQLSLVIGALPQLKALTPPPAKQAAVQQWLSGLQAQATTIKQTVAALTANDAAQVKADIAKLKKLGSANHAKAAALGLAQCAKNAVTGSASKGSGG